MHAARTLYIIVVTAIVATMSTTGCARHPNASDTSSNQREVCSHIVGVDGDRAIAVFLIANDSNVTKRVTKTAKSCNCYRADLSHTTIAPKEKVALSFYINQPGLRMPSKKELQCIVEFDDNSHYTCVADCTIYPSLAWDTKDLDVGTIGLHAKAVHEIPIVAYSHDQNPPAIKVSTDSSECQNNAPLVQYVATSRIDDHVWMHHGTIACSITPAIDRKGGGATVTLQRIPTDETEVISLGWSTKSLFNFHPRMLVLRGVKDVSESVAEVVVDRAGGVGDFTIERVEHPHEQLVQVAVENNPDSATAVLKLSLKSLVEGEPLYGDVLVYIQGQRAPLNVPFVIVP